MTARSLFGFWHIAHTRVCARGGKESLTEDRDRPESQYSVLGSSYITYIIQISGIAILSEIAMP